MKSVLAKQTTAIWTQEKPGNDILSNDHDLKYCLFTAQMAKFLNIFPANQIPKKEYHQHFDLMHLKIIPSYKSYRLIWYHMVSLQQFVWTNQRVLIIWHFAMLPCMSDHDNKALTGIEELSIKFPFI